MLEIIKFVYESLSQYQIAQTFFVVLIGCLGLMFYRKGEKDRKTGGRVEIPVYLLSGPVYDAMGAIHDIAEQSRTQTELLRALVAQGQARDMGQLYLIQLVEMSMNMKPSISRGSFPVKDSIPRE
jgi:hypothetical protein